MRVPSAPPARASRRLTGLLGGSFNPAHGGHRHISLQAIRALGLDEVWWLVSPGNPLKPSQGMAPLAARFASARRQARHAPIRVSAIEREFATRFTIDTLRCLIRRFPQRRFVWLMGADNLAQLPRWKDWRGIARLMPIAVIARPGYDGAALANPAAAWLGTFRKPLSSFKRPEKRSAPALVTLRFDPDARSATAIRRARPEWARGPLPRSMRDGLTHRPIAGTAA